MRRRSPRRSVELAAGEVIGKNSGSAPARRGRCHGFAQFDADALWMPVSMAILSLVPTPSVTPPAPGPLEAGALEVEQAADAAIRHRPRRGRWPRNIGLMRSTAVPGVDIDTGVGVGQSVLAVGHGIDRCWPAFRCPGKARRGNRGFQRWLRLIPLVCNGSASIGRIYCAKSGRFLVMAAQPFVETGESPGTWREHPQYHYPCPHSAGSGDRLAIAAGR